MFHRINECKSDKVYLLWYKKVISQMNLVMFLILIKFDILSFTFNFKNYTFDFKNHTF